MESRVLTHLSVEDLNVYLLGKPEPAQRTTIEEHYLHCSECLEQICALAARIDKWQLGQHFVPVPISSRELAQNGLASGGSFPSRSSSFGATGIGLSAPIPEAAL